MPHNIIAIVVDIKFLSILPVVTPDQGLIKELLPLSEVCSFLCVLQCVDLLIKVNVLDGNDCLNNCIVNKNKNNCEFANGILFECSATILTFKRGFRRYDWSDGVVVITSASHAEGRKFDPRSDLAYDSC